VPIYNDDGKFCDNLVLDENDPIFTLTFRQMISESFAEGKHFFLAKISTKSSSSVPQASNDQIEQQELAEHTTNHSHFFNAYGILKLLFKKKQEELVGRFHEKFPIAVKNPITNSVSAYLC